eukprot:7294952-Karenia_brevis.AAC.1
MALFSSRLTTSWKVGQLFGIERILWAFIDGGHVAYVEEKLALIEMPRGFLSNTEELDEA